MNTLKHLNTYIKMGSKGNFYLSTETPNNSDFIYGYINSNVGFEAGYEANLDGNLLMPTDCLVKYDKTTYLDNGFLNEYYLEKHSAKITQTVEFIDVFKLQHGNGLLS